MSAARRQHDEVLEAINAVRAEVAGVGELVAATREVKAELARAGRQLLQVAAGERAASVALDQLPAKWLEFVNDVQERNARAAAAGAAEAAELDTLGVLLPLKDAFLAARMSLPADDSPWRAVFEALDERLDLVLARLGATPLSALGGAFDPLLHEAVVAEEHPSVAGTIIAIVRQGYAFHGRVVRTARVGVSRGPALAPDLEAQGEALSSPLRPEGAVPVPAGSGEAAAATDDEPGGPGGALGATDRQPGPAGGN